MAVPLDRTLKSFIEIRVAVVFQTLEGFPFIDFPSGPPKRIRSPFDIAPQQKKIHQQTITELDLSYGNLTLTNLT